MATRGDMGTEAAAGLPEPGEDGTHVTFCHICEAVCGMVAQVSGGRIAKLGPDRDNPHSRGHICIKGPSMRDVVYDPDRLLRPMRRVGGPSEFEPVGWEEALADIAARLRAILDGPGSEAVAAYLGNPVFFNTLHWPVVFDFFARMKTGKLFGPNSQDHVSRMVANNLLYGDPLRMPLPDLADCDFLIIVGSNPLVSHGSMISAPRLREQLDAIAERGRIVVVDPRRTETAERFEHLSLRPDTDVWMLAAMVRTLFDEQLADLAFLDEHCVGWRALRDALAPITPALAAERCGLDEAAIVGLARDFAAVPRAVAYSRAGICRGRFSTLANLLLDALNMAGGKFCQPGGSMFGHALTTGSKLKGRPPDRLSRVGGLPSVISFLPGVAMPDELLEPGVDRVRALFMIAGNPVLSAPGGEALERALGGLDLFVACDLFVNESNKYADYILPTVTFLERAGATTLTFGNMLAPYLQYVRPVIEPQGDVRREDEIFGELSRRLFAATDVPVGEEILDGHIRIGAFGNAFGERPDGLTLDRLKRQPHGIMLESQSREERKRVGIKHADGKVHLWGDAIRDELARLHAFRDDGALRLFGRRHLMSINSWMHNVERLVRSQHPTLLIHPDDAAPRGIATGDRVVVANDYGAIEVEAELSEAVHRGSVCYPHGWGHDGGWRRANGAGGANVNLLSPTDPAAVEQLSGASLLDGIDVRVALAATPACPADGKGET
ncbi:MULTISPECIES: molybdopterin-containing oxidoreductase family protein [unclassified Sphingomonas]|uniref:molybdopterin-containing oxidoreductase family protein n=1 Tax=unclassified Sphingomonas TaxID=196159 RepID=UPI0006F3DCCC|nr:MULTISPECIES: molybdopterin-dependent oxidoreductase [unclassified Sphingomonas]KQX22821.1 hypothetical protein ASD17_06005 [Sphingomonas sp. Root1294]KQY67698.1 hypothetical protein ASD39_07115 [Sphingomonas sp. Root50]